jgi:glutathione synthase
MLVERGLLLAGVDVIGDSDGDQRDQPTCFQEIFDQTGCDVASSS